MHHEHHFWWRFFPKKELTQIYISTALRFFALSLLSLFIPLYLYIERGYSLDQTLYFFIFYAVVIGICSPIAAKFSSRFGAKHSVLFSIPFYLIFILMLYLLPQFDFPLFLIASFVGVSISFYWMGMHLIFYHASDRKHRGEEFGKREGLSVLATMFGPLVGGLLIKLIGFGFVFLLTSLILVGSAVFLFFSKEEHPRYHFSIRSLVDKKHWQNSLFFVSRGIRSMANGAIWPIFIFMILNDYLSLGIVGSILAGLSAFLIWFMGKYSDHFGKHKIIKYVVGLESISWFMRALVVTVTQVFSVTIFGAITFGVMEGPMGALEYNKARKKVAEYFVSREVFVCLGRILVLVLVLMTNKLWSGFVLTGFASLAALLF